MTITRQLQIVILVAFIIRLLLFYFFPLHMTDYMLINSAAQNLIDGHGMGFIKSTSEDLSNFYFEGLRLWPPLVTSLTALFLKLTGGHPATEFLMMTLVLVALVSILYLLCKEIGLKPVYIIYIFIVRALNPELIKRPGFSDLTAAFFSIWATFFMVKQLNNHNFVGASRVLLGSFIFFLPSAFRYQYYPISLFYPLYLVASALYLKDKNLLKRSTLSVFLVLLFIFIQEAFLYVYTAQPINQAVAMDKTGFFPFNLQNTYPFFFKAFINISYIENTWKDIIYPSRFYYFTFSATCLIVFVTFALRILLSTLRNQKKQENQQQQRKTLSVLSFIPLLLLPVLILVALSLTHNSRSGAPNGWTYVNEGRYYILPSLLLLLLMFWTVQKIWPTVSITFKTTFKTLFIIIMIYNLGLTLKFGYNVITNNIPDKELSNRLDRAAVYNYLCTLSKDEMPTVVTYSEPYFSFFPYLKNVAITNKIDQITDVKLKTRKKTRLLIICQKEKSEQEAAFLQSYNATPILYRPNCIIYSTIINPE